jgi:hypothetical protein
VITPRAYDARELEAALGHHLQSSERLRMVVPFGDFDQL